MLLFWLHCALIILVCSTVEMMSSAHKGRGGKTEGSVIGDLIHPKDSPCSQQLSLVILGESFNSLILGFVLKTGMYLA